MRLTLLLIALTLLAPTAWENDRHDDHLSDVRRAADADRGSPAVPDRTGVDRREAAPLAQRVADDPRGTGPAHSERRAPLAGIASWYRVGGLTAAAGPALRRYLGPSWRGATVIVSSGDASVAVRLVDWCQCLKGKRSERIIDLSDGAFSRLAPLASGLTRVTITVPAAPATDTE